MENKKEFKIAGMNYDQWRATCLYIGGQRMSTMVSGTTKKKSWMDIFKGLPKREKLGDPRNVERVAEFIRRCNERKKGGGDVDKIFKKCGFCGKEWKDFYDFLHDKDVFYRGVTEYQGNVVFFFDHTTCKTSMGITSEDMGRFMKFNNELFCKKAMN